MNHRTRLSRAFVASAVVVVVSVIGVAACMDASDESTGRSANDSSSGSGTASTDATAGQGQSRDGADATADVPVVDEPVTGEPVSGEPVADSGPADPADEPNPDESVTVGSDPAGELSGNLESDTSAEADLEAAAESDTVPLIPVSDQRTTPFRATGRKSGAETKRVQKRLLELGFWLNGVNGRYGLTTRQALFAFQKWAGLKRTGNNDEATAAALTNATHRAHASIADGTLVEIDETKQLFFLIREGRTMWVLNTATGTDEVYSYWNRDKPGTLEYDRAVTPNGVFTVYRQKRKGWWWGDLGKIYRPKYFSGGVAIHGMDIVPPEPASHGCVRLSLPAMDFIWDNDLVPLGTTIWVHGDPNASVSPAA